MTYRPAESHNLRLVGHTDLNGHGDAMQLMLKDHYLYVGHVLGNMGTTVVDVADPSNPKVVGQIEIPPYTHSHKVQIFDDLLIVNYEKYPMGPHGEYPEKAGIRILDIADRVNPREISFFQTGGRGVHRMWYAGGPYLHMSATPDGFSDRIMMIVDISDPANPEEVSKWWEPGMWIAGGETPTWSSDLRVGVHHPVVHGDRAYWGFWDLGAIIMDVSDPAHPREISRVSWPLEEGGHTHTAMPLPGRDLMVVADEATAHNCQESPKYVRIVDISDETAPKVLSKCPTPQGDFCERGLRFGPHNINENRPEAFRSEEIIFVTYFNAGLRVFDISDAESPQEIAYYIPETPADQEAIQTNDVFVAPNGLIYISDRAGAGVHILELTI